MRQSTLTTQSREVEELAAKLFPKRRLSQNMLEFTLLALTLTMEYKKKGKEYLVFTWKELAQLLKGNSFLDSTKRTQAAVIKGIREYVSTLASMSSELPAGVAFCITPIPQVGIDSKWDVSPPTAEQAARAYVPCTRWEGVLISLTKNGEAAVAWLNLNNNKGKGLMEENKSRALGWRQSGMLSANTAGNFGLSREKLLQLRT